MYDVFIKFNKLNTKSLTRKTVLQLSNKETKAIIKQLSRELL
jgi:hypothetical protein